MKRCDCGAEHRGEGDLCPRCERIEDGQFANDQTPYVGTSPWPWSRPAMKERLGITGEVDE